MSIVYSYSVSSNKASSRHFITNFHINIIFFCNERVLTIFFIKYHLETNVRQIRKLLLTYSYISLKVFESYRMTLALLSRESFKTPS